MKKLILTWLRPVGKLCPLKAKMANIMANISDSLPTIGTSFAFFSLLYPFSSIGFFMVANVGLCSLNCLWGFKIVQGLLKSVRGDYVPKESEHHAGEKLD